MPVARVLPARLGAPVRAVPDVRRAIAGQPAPLLTRVPAPRTSGGGHASFHQEAPWRTESAGPLPRAFRRRTYPGRGRAAQLRAEHEALSAELVLAMRRTARVVWVVYTLHDIEVELADLGCAPKHAWFVGAQR